MKIDIKEYLLNYIGHIDWHGETNYDNKSRENMEKAELILNEIEDIRDIIMSSLWEHKDYNIGNASAEMLHKKAERILRRRCLYDGSINEFNRDWS